MKSFKKMSSAITLLGACVTLGACIPGVAFSQEVSPWSVKSYLMLGAANESFSVDRPTGGQIEAGGNGIFGAGAAVEYRINKRYGLEAGAAYTKTPDTDYDSNGASTEVGEGPAFSPMHVGVNVHIVDTDRIDFFIGTRVAFVSFGDFDLDVDGQRVNFEADSKSNDFAWGATAGFSYQLANTPLSLTAELTYLEFDMEVTEVGTANADTLSFDPVYTHLGISYQF